MQLPIFPKFLSISNGVIYDTLWDAAINEKRLTIDNGYDIIRWSRNSKFFPTLCKQFKKTGTFRRRTLFKEIKAVPIDLPYNIGKRTNRKYVDSNQFVKLIYNALYESIEENWDNSIPHFMLHSSGRDSRLISGILTNLIEKHGSNWIGKIYFICFKPDIECFKPIMEFEGWPEESIIYINGNDIDYTSESLQFDKLGKWLNDIRLTWWDYYVDKIIKERGYKTNEVCIVSALFSDEIHKRGWKFPYEFVIEWYLTVRFQLSKYKTFIPFVMDKVIDVFSEYSCKDKKFKIKDNLSDMALPGLSQFSNYDDIYSEIKREYCRGPHHILSEGTLDKMRQDFQSSWYYKVKKLNFILENYSLVNIIQEHYKEYMKASICECLIQEGVDIII